MNGTKRKRVIKASDLRVIIFTPCYHVLDGVSLTVRKINDEVKSQGGSILIATSDSGRPYLTDENILFCPSEPLPYDTTDRYSLCRMLDDETKAKVLAFKPNVLHITSPDPMCYSVCVWARENQLPLCGTWHSNIPDYLDHVGFLQRRLFKPILVYAFQTVYSYPLWTYVPTQYIYDKMREEEYESPVTKNELKIWGRGVDVNLFNPNKRSKELRKEHNVTDDQVVIIWVGRCVKEKRPEVYIHVLEKLHKNYPGKVVGFLVGRGDKYDLMASVPNVRSLGWRNREELAEAYASSDILLFPSSVETFGNVTLEGMASGLPCVVDKTCSSHLIEDGKIGFTCEPNVKDQELFEEYYVACEKLVVDKELRKKMSQAARKDAVDKWEIKFVMNQMVQNYIQVANWTPEDLPKITWRIRDYINYCLFVFIDKGGFVMVKVLALFAFQWQNADKMFGFMVAIGLLCAISAFLVFSG